MATRSDKSYLIALERIEHNRKSKDLELDLVDLDLDIIPPAIVTLSHLRVLDVSNNKLTSLPEDFGKLQNLVEFRMAHNKLRIFPSEIAHLSKLRRLLLNNNMLKSIGDDFLLQICCKCNGNYADSGQN